jgi:hypothetical protein
MRPATWAAATRSVAAQAIFSYGGMEIITSRIGLPRGHGIVPVRVSDRLSAARVRQGDGGMGKDVGTRRRPRCGSPDAGASRISRCG